MLRTVPQTQMWEQVQTKTKGHRQMAAQSSLSDRPRQMTAALLNEAAIC